jgi:hypothetical protein
VINVIVVHMLARDRTENRIPLFLITRWTIAYQASSAAKAKFRLA